MDLLTQFKQYIQNENLFQLNERLLLAVSGGVDSVVLCELCKRAGFYFEIAHCNFQLRGDDSTRDEKFAAALAKNYGVAFHLQTFDTVAYAKASKKSVEEAARNLRYEWFYSLLKTNNKSSFGIEPPVADAKETTCNYILTAHHADDNIETVLINFFRGTGIAGLRGILPKQNKLIRPLLFARRSQLEDFVQANSLPFVTDHTNLQNDYTRNYFRNKIIPLVSEKFPGTATNIINNIQRFKETEMLYQQAVELHIKKLAEQKGNEIHIPVLKLLKTKPLATVLYEIIKGFGFTAHQTEEAVSLLKSETGKYIQSATHRLIKNRNWLIISPVQTIAADNILIEEGDNKIIFKGGSLSIKKILAKDYLMQTDPLLAHVDCALIQFPLLLRKWKTGDYFYPLGMQKKKKLSRFFIDQKLSLTQKENTWVLEMDQKIVWVVGLRIDDRFKITPSTKNILKLVIY